MRNNLPHSRDPRWTVFNQLQIAREAIGIKTRSLTVLRGLLSFVTLAKWEAGDLMVYPSNRALQERCDAMDERTLRRHLSHLCEAGVIQRKMSPNRKRYTVRDEHGVPVICYGFDLSGLKAHATRIAALAENARREAMRLRSLRSILRHLLWESHATDTEAFKLLRRKATPEQLEVVIEKLRKASEMTDSHGQNDRHIQNPNKEYIEESGTSVASHEIAPEECIQAVRSAIELALTPIENWDDLRQLAHNLAPALGVDTELQKHAKASLGENAYTLAILGMVQAINRIKNAPRYLIALSHKAVIGTLNPAKMFRSLTRNHQFSDGNQQYQ